jgi:hypothetical protein
MNREFNITIQTGFNDANPNHKYIEFEFIVDGVRKTVRIPFQTLEKMPLNNTPVFFVKGKTQATPEELQTLLEDLKFEIEPSYENTISKSAAEDNEVGTPINNESNGDDKAEASG